jgi:hypothetical protein
MEAEAVSNTTATVARRAIADCRAIEKQEPRSAIAARTDAESRKAAKRGTAKAMTRPRRTTTIINSSRVKAARRTLEWTLDASHVRDHFAAHAPIHPHPFSVMRPMRLLLVPVLALILTSCTNPRAEANMAQALNDAANEIGGLKNDIAQIQTDLDSLRSVVAKQDSVINRIAAANNIPR